MNTKEQLEEVTTNFVRNVSDSYDFQEPNFVYALLDSIVISSVLAGVKAEYIEDAILRLFMKLLDIKSMSEEDKKKAVGALH